MSPWVFDGGQPKETHEHYDAAGNLTGTTVVTHDSVWDERTRQRAFALMTFEARQCPGCKSYDSLVELEKELRHVTWEAGVKVEVVQYRCRVCASVDTIRRDVSEANKDVKPVTGHATWSDGRMYAGRPLIDKLEA